MDLLALLGGGANGPVAALSSLPQQIDLLVAEWRKREDAKIEELRKQTQFLRSINDRLAIKEMPK